MAALTERLERLAAAHERAATRASYGAVAPLQPHAKPEQQRAAENAARTRGHHLQVAFDLRRVIEIIGAAE